MYRVFACLATEHDLRLVFLAGAVCFFASLTAVSLVHRAQSTAGRVRALWITTAGTATGCGIWATHFIAMLAYDPGVGINYGVGLTLLSFLVAAVVTGVGLGVAVLGPRAWAAPAGGAVLGAGVACMHFIGMSAVEMPGYVSWSPGLVLLSITCGLLCGAAALTVATRWTALGGCVLGATLLTLAIVSHHFTAMGAIEIVADPTRVINPFSLSPISLAVAIANAAMAILGMSLAGAFVDKRAADHISHVAQHDPLTGLPNRAAFGGRLQRVFRDCAPGAQPFAVLSIDLDRFKEINDVFGHSAGDALLWEVAERLRNVAPAAIAARLGGDEFVMLLRDEDQPANAAAVAQGILAALSADLEIGVHRVRIAASIGAAVYPRDGQTPSTLLSNADAALYRAKAEGRGTVTFFSAEIDQQLREKRALQHDLGAALARNELSLVYQPQATTQGEITGFEALIRWSHPTRGMVPPSTFIPLAEESSLIVTIGEWVLREAAKEAASWGAPLNIAVNLSPAQFRGSDLPSLVDAVLWESGLAPARLELEITEGVFMGDAPRAVSMLRRLKALGVRVAMDDFGTGYSSLSYLQAFPFDKIKIDRAFILNLNTSQQSAAIVRAVIGLARGLEVPVLAEGVETQEQLAFLVRESCDQVQGYLFGKPGRIGEYASLLESLAPPYLNRAVA